MTREVPVSKSQMRRHALIDASKTLGKRTRAPKPRTWVRWGLAVDSRPDILSQMALLSEAAAKQMAHDSNTAHGSGWYPIRVRITELPGKSR